MITRKIMIYNEIGNSSCMTEHDGLMVYELIDKELKENISVQLDFQNIETYTPAFLNAAIGQLYRDYDIQFIRDKLNVVNILPEDMALLTRIVDNAKLFYSISSIRLQKAIDDTLSNS